MALEAFNAALAKQYELREATNRNLEGVIGQGMFSLSGGAFGKRSKDSLVKEVQQNIAQAMQSGDDNVVLEAMKKGSIMLQPVDSAAAQQLMEWHTQFSATLLSSTQIDIYKAKESREVTKAEREQLEHKNTYRINQIIASERPTRIREKLSIMFPSISSEKLAPVTSFEALRIFIEESALRDGVKLSIYNNIVTGIEAEEEAYRARNIHNKTYIVDNEGTPITEVPGFADKIEPPIVNRGSKVVSDLEKQIETLQLKETTTVQEATVKRNKLLILGKQKDEAIKALPGRVNAIEDELDKIRSLDINKLSSVEIDTLIQQIESLIKDNEEDLGDRLREGRLSDKYTGAFTLARGPSVTDMAMNAISFLMSAPNYVDKTTGK